jgi:basic membrane protein A
MNRMTNDATGQSHKRVKGWRSALAGLAVAGVVVLLAGCGSSSSSSSESAAAGTSGTSTSASANNAVDGLKVGYITSTPINQGAWDPQQYQAFHAAEEKYHWHVHMAQTVAPSQAQQVLTGFAESGNQLIIATSSQFEDAVRAVAAKFPKVKFAILDDAGQKPLTNEAVYEVNWYEFGYLGGAAGALASSNGKIGLITGLAIPANLKAFGTAGAGGQQVDPNSQTLTSFTNDFLDPAKGAYAASGLISKGATATFAIGGAMDGAILKTAAAHGIKGIGSYKDESSFAPSAVATSVILNWTVAYDGIAQQLGASSWQPGVRQLTVANDGITVLPFKNVPDPSAKTKKMNDLIASIKNGSVQVPQTELAHH